MDRFERVGPRFSSGCRRRRETTNREVRGGKGGKCRWKSSQSHVFTCSKHVRNEVGTRQPAYLVLQSIRTLPKCSACHNIRIFSSDRFRFPLPLIYHQKYFSTPPPHLQTLPGNAPRSSRWGPYSSRTGHKHHRS